jgi:ribosome-associated translation inhibitor RaiA
MYIAIDRAVQKLERQISGAKGSAQSKQRRSGETVRNGLGPDNEETPLES